MSDKSELNINEDDPAVNNLVRLLKLPKGKINIQIDNKPSLSLDFRQDKLLVDVKDSSIFEMIEEEENDQGLFEIGRAHV